MKIALIRHGETALQAAKKYQGSTDEPLSPEGAWKLSAADFQPPVVYVTPLVRTQQTARILFPKAQQIVVPGLAEMDFGIFEGRSAEEMQDDTAYRQWVDSLCLAPCPGGEQKADFCDRVCEAFCKLVRQTAEENRSSADMDAYTKGNGRTVPDLVVVAHGGVQMAIMERFAEEKRDYWKWMLPSGCGYLLETKTIPGCEDYHGKARCLDRFNFPEESNPDLKLRILDILCFMEDE